MDHIPRAQYKWLKREADKDPPPNSLTIVSLAKRLGKSRRDVCRAIAGLNVERVYLAQCVRWSDVPAIARRLGVPPPQPPGAGLLREGVPAALHQVRPTIAVTGYTSDAYLDGAYRAGANAVMSKPLDLPDFVSTARDLVKLDKPKETKTGPTVLAVGLKPGDVESGCGGILLKHRHQSHNVIVALTGKAGPAGSMLDSVADLYGAEVVVNPAAADTVDEGATARWLAELVAEHTPLIMYVPSERDGKVDRAATQRAALEGGEGVPKVLGYQTPNSTPEFAPDVFVDIDEFMDRKLAMVRQYEGFDLDNVEMDMTEATARYWGRFAGPERVEPLEVLRG